MLGVIFLLASMSTCVFAQEGDSSQTQMRVIADVDIHNALVVEQKDHDIDMMFNIDNGVGSQPDIRYAVELKQYITDDDGQVLVYRHVFDDVVVLGEHSSVQKEITAHIPQYFVGKYGVWLSAKNSEGTPLSSAFLGDMQFFGGDTQYINIDTNTCYFSVQGANDKYNLMQGVDINSSEKLLLTCVATNGYNHDITIAPTIQTYQRTFFGKHLDTKQSDSIDFKAGEQKEITMTIPTQDKSQAYSIIVSLTDKQIQSNEIYAHYVVQGESATVSTIQLDKLEYAKGDDMHVSFLASGSADRFGGARGQGTVNEKLYYDVSVTDKKSHNCIEPIKHQLLNQDGIVVDVHAATVRNCQKPTVNVVLKNDKDVVLAQLKNTFDDTVTQSQNIQQKTQQEAQQKNTSMKKIGWIIAIVLTVIALILIGVGKMRNNTLQVFVFFAIATSMMLVFGHRVSAKTLELRGVTCDFSLSKTKLSPGEAFTGTSSDCVIHYCGNKIQMKAYVNNVVTASFENKYNKIKGNYTERPESTATNITAGNKCQNYDVPIKLWLNHYNDWTWYENGVEHPKGWEETEDTDSLPYTVEGCNTVTADFSVSATGCTDMHSQTTGKVVATVTNVKHTGSTATAKYRYKCGSGEWSSWATSPTHTCTITDPKTTYLTVSVEINYGDATISKNAGASIAICTINGECKPSQSPLPQQYLKPSSNLCANGSTATAVTGNGSQTNPWSWNCIGSGPNHTNAVCKALAKVDCAGPDGQSNINTKPTKPTYPLCSQNSTPNPQPTLNAQGKWIWKCVHNNAGITSEDCVANSCLADMPIKYQKNVYFDTEGNPRNASVEITCPNVCCKINGTKIDGTLNPTICTGDGVKEMEVEPGAKSYPAECYFKGSNPTPNPDPPVEKTLTISTMCASRTCNSQGTCQATPVVASSNKDCQSSCNSNADCANGRIIETRP